MTRSRRSPATAGSCRALVSHALSLIRTIGTSVARMADAAVSLFLADVESPLALEGCSELELAQRGDQAVGALEGFGSALDPLMRRLALQAIEETRRTTVHHTERFQYRYAIGFVDLVGLTEVSADMTPAELGGFIRDFEGRPRHRGVSWRSDREADRRRSDVRRRRPLRRVPRRHRADGGVRVDRRHGAAPGRFAFGNVLPRGVDYYATVVNLAARLVDEAVPQELPATEPLADEAVGCVFEPAGRRMVTGFAEPVPVPTLVEVT